MTFKKSLSAGKTEATKQSLNFLTLLASSGSVEKKVVKDEAGKVDIAERIIAASPILEAFGNAKTVKNPNSSRFGKWMELNFDSSTNVTGSTITSYLLEKSRVRSPRFYVVYLSLLDPSNVHVGYAGYQKGPKGKELPYLLSGQLGQ